MQSYFVYLVASKPRGTLYIGVTNDLVRRSIEHRDGLVPGFTKRYAVKTLVYFELFHDISAAIQREKSLKRWPRDWKLNLIERENPHWRICCRDSSAREVVILGLVPRIHSSTGNRYHASVAARK